VESSSLQRHGSAGENLDANEPVSEMGLFVCYSALLEIAHDRLYSYFGMKSHVTQIVVGAGRNELSNRVLTVYLESLVLKYIDRYTLDTVLDLHLTIFYGYGWPSLHVLVDIDNQGIDAGDVFSLPYQSVRLHTFIIWR
jgi:hypothetical protein